MKSIGRSKAGARDVHPFPGPNSFNFMQLLGKFGKIACWHPLEVWCSLDPRSANVYILL